MIYDLAIIGGGPAGYSAALEAVKYGLSVVLFEKELLGGTCLNRGCVPTKFLVHVAELYDSARNASRYGFHFENMQIDFPAINQKMWETVAALRGGIEGLLLQKKIDIVTGFARIESKNCVKCKDILYKAKNILIASGSKPSKPVIANAISSDEIWNRKELPKKVHIIGGGVIAVEFANIFRQLGSDVTISIRGERILKRWDRELAVGLTQNLKKSGIKIRTNCTQTDWLEEGYELILAAFGREKNTECLGSQDILLDETGAILTNPYGQTNKTNIFAAGDVIADSSMLAYIAMEQGKRIVKYIVAQPLPSCSAVASCIYTNPEIASIGITESEAKSRGIEVVVGKQNMRSNASTLITTEKRSFIKVIAEKHTHSILGAQLMCERASDMAGEFVLAMNNGLTVEKMKQAVHPHPSFSEAIMDVMDLVEEKLDAI